MKNLKNLKKSDKQSFYKNLFMPLKAKAGNNFDVYGFDVETTHIKEDFKRKSGKIVSCWKQEFLMGSVYGEGTEEVFWDRKEMADHLLKRKYMGGMMVATNLEFDFNILYYDCLEKFKLVYSNGLIAAIKSDKKNDKRRKWTFTDTLNYMRCSLGKLAEIVSEQKMSMPSTMKEAPGISIFSRPPTNPFEKQEVINYNVNDSKITYLFAKKFKDFCTQHNMKMKLTIGSTGMDYWRRNHQKHPMIREKEGMVMKHFQGSFRGGMTQTFKRGTYNDKMWYFDYRSAYPAVMTTGIDRKGNYPDPSSSVYKEKGNTELIEHYEGICYAHIKAPYAYIPYLGYKAPSGKLLFSYGEFDGWFTHYELRKAMNLGYEVDPGEMIYYYNIIKPFKDAVEYLYKLRKEYKQEKHPFEAMVKVLMNSGLFGKWGTNPNNMEEIIALKSIEFKNGMPHYKNKPISDAKIFESIGLFDGFITRKKPSKPFKYSFPIWSEYTTALGRDKLMTDIRKYPKNIVYCDTDSAVVDKPVFEEGLELGDWEKEHELEGGVFIKSKLYMLKLAEQKFICKSKGVGKFMKEKDDFIKVVNTGSVDMERFTKMKESNNIGIKSGSVMQFSKHLSFNDDKRNWNGKDFSLDDWQDSEPLELVGGITKLERAGQELKARLSYEREREKEQASFINSDLFDKTSVGKDISPEEFIENEKWFAREE